MFQSQQINFPLIIITGTVTFFVLVISLFVFVKKYQQRRFQYLQEKQELQSQFQQELLRAQLEIQEQTLKNVSQEIHDNIGQTLSLVRLNLSPVGEESLETSKEKIIASKALVSKAIKDLRNLSKTLDTDAILAAGLINALQTELELIDKSKAFQTTFKISGAPVQIAPTKELILFRIVQEAINNIIKHSQATVLSIEIVFEENGLTLSVADNGRGLDATAHAIKDQGSGLRNMRNRAQLLGGTFELESNQTGTQIKVTLPISQS